MREIAIDGHLTRVDRGVGAQCVRQPDRCTEHLLDFLDGIERLVLWPCPALFTILVGLRAQRSAIIVGVAIVENPLCEPRDIAFRNAGGKQRSPDETLVGHIEIDLANLVLDSNAEPVTVAEAAAYRPAVARKPRFSHCSRAPCR